MSTHTVITFAIGMILGYIVAGLSNLFATLLRHAIEARDEARKTVKELLALVPDDEEWDDETESEQTIHRCVFCATRTQASVGGVYLCSVHLEEYGKGRSIVGAPKGT